MKSSIITLIGFLAVAVVIVVFFFWLGVYGALAIILLIVASLNQAERVNE